MPQRQPTPSSLNSHCGNNLGSRSSGGKDIKCNPIPIRRDFFDITDQLLILPMNYGGWT